MVVYILRFFPCLRRQEKEFCCIVLLVDSSAHILERVQIPLPWLSCLSVCRWRKRRCVRLFPSRSLSSWYRKGHVAIFPSSSLLHARTTRPISPCSPQSPWLQCMHFQLFQNLDFRLSFIESKLRNMFLSTPCKRGAKQTTISNLRNMQFWISSFTCNFFFQVSA